MTQFSAAGLADLAAERGLVFRDHVMAEVVAALDSGKHIMLTGSPGTGKTSLAYLAADLAHAARLCTGHIAVTASAEWTVGDTVGRYASNGRETIFQAGIVLHAIETGAWLVIDELNRADFDKAFGPLFTVLANHPVTLPFKHPGHSNPLSIVPAGAETPRDTEPIRVPSRWRIIATMNEFDKESLYRMSYALMRRFAFVEVDAPGDDVFRKLMMGPAEFVAELLPVRRFVDLGPAVFIDACHYAERRLEDSNVTQSRILFETFYSFFLPQLDQLSDTQAAELFEALAPAFERQELHDFRRAVRKMLGQPEPAPAKAKAPKRPAAKKRTTTTRTRAA
jgi:hypothetical protein